MANTNLNIQDVKTVEDVSAFFDAYRGSGINKIIKQQFTELYDIEDQLGFSHLGNFLDLAMDFHKNMSTNREIRDDYMYNEIESLLAEMSKNPEYNEYSDFLVDKITEMKAADQLKNQDI